jgi:DNA repair ATPase RecN
MLTLLLVAMLLAVGATPLASAQDDKSVKDKVAQLEKQLKELEAVVKSLSIELQKLTQAGTGEIENIRPRLFAVEQLAKDLSFDLKKLSGRISNLEGQVEQLAELPQQVSDLKYSVGELASRMKANELAIGQLRDQLEKLAGIQALVINLQGTVGTLSNRVEVVEKGLAALTDQVGKLQALTPLVKGLQDTTANLSVRVGAHRGDARQAHPAVGAAVGLARRCGERAELCWGACESHQQPRGEFCAITADRRVLARYGEQALGAARCC